MSEHEEIAHRAIVGVLDAAIAYDLHWQHVARATERHLESFAPRCPACASVLKRKALEGMAVLSCGCGWTARVCR